MFSGLSAGFLKVAAIAVVAGGLAGGVVWAANAGGSDDSTSGAQAEPSATVAVTPQSTAAPTATEQPLPTDPPPTPTPQPTDVPPAPTLDTRVAIMDPPTLDQIQLRKDGKYFIADRGDGCTWVERVRRRYESVGLEVSLFTDCPVDFFFAFMPETGEISLFQE